MVDIRDQREGDESATQRPASLIAPQFIKRLQWQKGAMPLFLSHDKFSGTMGVVFKEVVTRFHARQPNVRILDIPAGAGHLSERLRQAGFEVASADINLRKEDYVFADMNKTLPFPDGQFDVVTSVEGIEHIIHYENFIRELSRITRKGGFVILTTPNVSCFYSRFMFMCTGNFFQFWPAQGFVNVDGEETFDYGHITPLTWQKISFHFAHHGLTLVAMRGNKMKRKILFPLYIPFLIIGLPWIAYRLRYTGKIVQALSKRTDFYRSIEKFSYSLPGMFSRNIVMVFEKKHDVGSGHPLRNVK